VIINISKEYRLLGKPAGWFLQKRIPETLIDKDELWENVASDNGQAVIFYDLPSARDSLVDYFIRSTEGESVEDFQAALAATVDMINKPFKERLQPGVIQTPPKLV
jgi:hypothetical protein